MRAARERERVEVQDARGAHQLAGLKPTSPLKGTLKQGDRIVRVDGVDTAECTHAEIARLLADGREKASRELTIQPPIAAVQSPARLAVDVAADDDGVTDDADFEESDVTEDEDERDDRRFEESAAEPDDEPDAFEALRRKLAAFNSAAAADAHGDAPTDVD